jgi:hypothetical protein
MAVPAGEAASVTPRRSSGQPGRALEKLVEILHGETNESVAQIEPRGAAVPDHFEPRRARGVFVEQRAQHGAAEATPLMRRLDEEVADLQVIGMRLRGDAADALATDEDQPRVARAKARAEALGAARRIEAEQAFQIGAQRADREIEQRLEIRFRRARKGEAQRSASQKRLMRAQASRSEASSVA